MKTTVRVVLYNRVSDPPKLQKDGTYKSRQDPENQAVQMRERVAKAAEDKSWKLIHEYVDEETAGGKRERPQFLQLLADAKAGKFDVVVFWSLDRFSREGVLETLNYLEELKKCGVQWLSHTEEYLTSMGPFADGVIAILACVAKQERIRLSERVKAALDRARRPVEEGGLGKKIGGRPKNVDWDAFQRACQVGFSTHELQKMFGLSANWIRQKRRELMAPQTAEKQEVLAGSDR